MDLTTITPAQFKAQFPRDFPYATVTSQDPAKYVLDSDITAAFAQAMMKFNQSLVPSPAGLTPDQTITIAFLYLAAHFLCIDIRNALGGVQGSGGSFPVTGRTVGSVSESYEVPPKYLNNPNISYLASTGYGLKYLSFVLPNLVGNMFASPADTNP